MEIFLGGAGLGVVGVACGFVAQVGWAWVYERRRGLRPRMFADAELPEPEGHPNRFSVVDASDGGRVWYFGDGVQARKYRDALRAQGHLVTLKDGKRIR